MGIVRLGIPDEIVSKLQASFGIQTFVETGTHLGASALWASDRFQRVVTIEASEEFYNSAKQRLETKTNISIVLGDCRACLPQIIANLSSPSLFWLDGHYSGGATFGEKDECPLLGEIAVLNASMEEHFILIDDARLFLAPPPLPHAPEQWPTIDVVCQKLQEGPKPRYVVVYEDVIYAVPLHAKNELLKIVQSKTTEAFYAYLAEVERAAQERNRVSLAHRVFRRMKQSLRPFVPKSI